MGRLFLFFKRRVTGSCGAFFIFLCYTKIRVFPIIITIIAINNTNAQMRDFSKFKGRIVPFRGMDDDGMEDCNSQ